MAARNQRVKPKAYMHLAEVSARLGDMDAAKNYYDRLLNMIEHPAAREYVKAELLIRIFPRSRSHIQQAAGFLEKALELEPDYRQAKVLLEGANEFLEITSKEAAEKN